MLPQLQQTRLIANKQQVISQREAQSWDGAFKVRRGVCAQATHYAHQRRDLSNLISATFYSCSCKVWRCVKKICGHHYECFTCFPGPASQWTIFRHSEELWDSPFLSDSMNGTTVNQEGAEVLNLEERTVFTSETKPEKTCEREKGNLVKFVDFILSKIPAKVSRVARCHHQLQWKQSVHPVLILCLCLKTNIFGGRKQKNTLLLTFSESHFRTRIYECRSDLIPVFWRREQQFIRCLWADMWQISALFSHSQTCSPPSEQPAITCCPCT